MLPRMVGKTKSRSFRIVKFDCRSRSRATSDCAHGEVVFTARFEVLQARFGDVVARNHVGKILCGVDAVLIANALDEVADLRLRQKVTYRGSEDPPPVNVVFTSIEAGRPRSTTIVF